VLGACVGFVLASTSFDELTPSDRARALGRSISEAMNLAALCGALAIPIGAFLGSRYLAARRGSPSR
jgi:hypothetical protein